MIFEKNNIIFSFMTRDEFVEYEKKVYTNFNFAKKEFKTLDIYEINDMDPDIFEFKRPSKIKRIELIESIRHQGVIEPLLVYKTNLVAGDCIYSIISGYERLIALKYLYDSTNDSKYKNVDVIVYDDSEVSTVMVQNMRLDSNMNRQMDLLTRVRFAVCKCKTLKLLKKKRNEFNIAEEVSKQMGISKSTLYTYLGLENLIDEFLKLLSEKKITMANALKLAEFSEEYQRKILNGFGGADKVKNYVLRKIPKDHPRTTIAMDNMMKYIELLLKKGPPKSRINIECKTEESQKLSMIIKLALQNSLMGHHKVKVVTENR